jgi:hypothetical protein
MSVGLPKASSLYIRSRYYDSTTGKFLLTNKSTENPTSNTWSALTNTIPNTLDGFVYTNVFLHKRMPSANARLAIGKGVYIDPKVTLS